MKYMKQKPRCIFTVRQVVFLAFFMATCGGKGLLYGSVEHLDFSKV